MMDLSIDISRAGIPEKDLAVLRTGAQEAMDSLWNREGDFTGWMRLPLSYDREELREILTAAREMQKKCDLLIVIGIGGSYLGARAALEALGGSAAGCPEIRFAGNNLSGTYHAQLLRELERRDTCLCVISKSGTTTEPGIAFAALKEALREKYGKAEAARRIYAVTDARRGILREEADREGYETFVIPDDIGGRYSVLTPVGLLPLAAAGIDVTGLLAGAEAMASAPGWDHDLADYACSRLWLMEQGKAVEVIEYYEPCLQYFAEWLKQLFGESEGKEGKGLFPASLSFSADLHSMGQFLQEGSPIFFETVLLVNEAEEDILLPESAGEAFAGKSMNAINRAAAAGVIAAHQSAGVPVIRIALASLTPIVLGQMIYFFEMTSAVTGTLMGVNPFDQPGVERYKEEMRKEVQKIVKSS